MIEIQEDWCKGCELCINRCPVNALELSSKLNKKGIHPPRLKDDNECNFCRLCELICPDFAITVVADEEEKLSVENESKLIIGGVAVGTKY